MSMEEETFASQLSLVASRMSVPNGGVSSLRFCIGNRFYDTGLREPTSRYKVYKLSPNHSSADNMPDVLESPDITRV